MDNQNPWKREPARDNNYIPDDLHYLLHIVPRRPMFSMRDDRNIYMDAHTKRAALKASPSVVSLVSYTGEEELYQSSGTIIESDSSNRCMVLTSARLIRRQSKEEFIENELAHNLKVVVKLSEHKFYEGEIYVYDFHFNLVVISFKSDSSLLTARLSRVDDSIDLNPNQPVIPSDSISFNLVPGDTVIAIGRYFDKPFGLMAAPGEYRFERLEEYDCKELFSCTCRITRCGDGCPVITRSGEVIGIAFYGLTETPFMPINIAIKWLDHYNSYGELRRPYLGMEATNFFAVDLDMAEKIIQDFPSLSKAVLVEKVMPGSPAESAGLRLDDVVIQFGGKDVHSFLELCEMTWEKVGHPVELVVARVGHKTPLHLKMVVAEATKLNSWPRWDYR